MSTPRPSSQGSGCPTPLLHLPDSKASAKGCECPMCYHSVKNPCASCGCPTSQRSQESNPAAGSAEDPNPRVEAAAAARGRTPAHPFTSHQSTAAFFSPSSDYYSLSPDSPPPNLEPSPPPPPSSSQPATSQPPQPSSTSTSSNASNPPLMSQPTSNHHQPNQNGVKPKTSLEIQNLYSSVRKPLEKPRPPVRKPSMPPAVAAADSKSNRRHSWAGDRGGNKPTSLQDFKKLLAQQPMGNNNHRISAREMLESSQRQSTASGGGNQRHTTGGSLRKRSWKDPRFSVIEEDENEAGRSRENLIE